MGPFLTIQSITTGIFLTVGLLHLAIYFRRPTKRTDLFFALMCLMAGLAAVLQALSYETALLADYRRLYKLQVNCQGVMWIMMVWFIASLTGTASVWIRNLATAGYTVAIAVNSVASDSVLLARIEQLKHAVLPWGERLTYGVGPANPWRIVADVSWLLMICLMVDCCMRLYRYNRRRALFIGISLFITLGPAYVQGTLVDFGMVSPPLWDTFSLLALVLIMSGAMVGQVIRASELKDQVGEQERRWRTLLENVSLLVVGVGRDGRINYANPMFCAVSGYAASDVRGKPLLEIIPASERETVRESLNKAIAGEVKAQVARPLLTASGEIRQVSWFHVLLHEGDRRVLGTLSIGADITELEAAKKDRDRHLADLEQLKEQLQRENIYLKEEILAGHGFTEIVGQSNALLYVLSKVKQVAETDATVIIQGETGVGKELIARAIHNESQRANGPFVRIDCTALPVNLVESELFGHEAGAFTGATRQRKGRFELAEGGTVFLDEVSELPEDLQAKLLRVLQEKEFERVGGGKTISTDARILAATNRDLSVEISAGRFRADLFYRLNVYPITVPPLRNRKDDLSLLVNHFISRFARRLGKTIDQVPAAVMDQLVAYDWPGNVRELRNVIERAVITSAGPDLRLPESLGSGLWVSSGDNDTADTLPPLSAVESAHIRKALDATGWRINGPQGAAIILGLNPSTLRFRMKKLGIRKS